MYKEGIVQEERNLNYKVVLKNGDYCKFYSWDRAYDLFLSDEGAKLYLLAIQGLKNYYALAMWK